MNIEHRRSNIERCMEKDELIKIFVTVSERLERNKMDIHGSASDFFKQMKLNCRAKRHHYSMFNVGCSTFMFISIFRFLSF